MWLGLAIVVASLVLYVLSALRFNLGGMLVSVVVGAIGLGIFLGAVL